MGERLVEPPRRQLRVELAVQLHRGIEHPVHFVARHRRGKHHRRSRREEQPLKERVLKLLPEIPLVFVSLNPLPLELLVHKIPLVHDDDDGLGLLDDFAGDRLVLLRHALHRIDHEEDDVGPLDRVERAQPGEIFNG